MKAGRTAREGRKASERWHRPGQAPGHRTQRAGLPWGGWQGSVSEKEALRWAGAELVVVRTGVKARAGAQGDQAQAEGPQGEAGRGRQGGEGRAGEGSSELGEQ